jgi:hypothetical protein
MIIFVCGKAVRWPCEYILVCPLPRRACPQLPQVDDRRSDIAEQIADVCVGPLAGPWHAPHAVLMTQVSACFMFVFMNSSMGWC